MLINIVPNLKELGIHLAQWSILFKYAIKALLSSQLKTTCAHGEALGIAPIGNLPAVNFDAFLSHKEG